MEQCAYQVMDVLGLGTSTSKEAKEYFTDMARHRIRFRYGGQDDDMSLDMAFSKKRIEDRKTWLTSWMAVRYFMRCCLIPRKGNSDVSRG